MDYTLFNHTAKVLVPEVSAEEYEIKKQLRLSPRHSPRHSPRSSPRHSPRSSSRNSPRSSPRPSPRSQHHENLLKPPTVTVELVNDSQTGSTDSTSQADDKHRDTLALPNDLTSSEI